MYSVQELVARSKVAQKQFEFVNQETADAAAKAICKVVYDNREEMGRLAAEESRMGKVEDKIAKCKNKSSQIWTSIKNRPSVGIIERDEEHKIMKVAKPMGVVASIVPSTNPIVTPMSNAAFALKCRNSVIFAPHPRAVQCTQLLVEKFRAELKKLGLPEDLVLTLDHVSNEDSAELMASADVVVATGGSGMVKAAYSSGRPALGVGQGNVQCIVDRDVDLDDAADKIITGRSFDNGLICLGEQTAFVPQEKYDDFVAAFKRQGGYFIDDDETVAKMRECIFPNGGAISRDVVGLTAAQVAKLIGLEVPADTRVLGVKVEKIAENEDLCREKLCPVLAVKGYDTWEDGVAMMVADLENEGKGHSVAVHSNSQEHVEYAAIQCSVSRCVVNQPSGTTGGGSPYNGFTPTTTLGCGSWGGNSFSGNFDMVHLMNITRIGYPWEKPWLEKAEDAWVD